MSVATVASSFKKPGQDQIDRLRAQPRQPGEASFFYYDSNFRGVAVKVLPGEYFVSTEDILLMTTLGSCISACLWDRRNAIGGMNHFMLPESRGERDSGRYGAYAMELLINQMIKRGAVRSCIEAKIFGGGAVIGGMSAINVGEKNTEFVMDYLRSEKITVVSKDVLEVYPRKVCFLPVSGKAMVKRLNSSNPQALVEQDRAAARAAAAKTSGGSVDLF